MIETNPMCELAKKLEIGMQMSEVEEILGPPSGLLSGSGVMGMCGSAAGARRAISSLIQQQYVIWRRPEGVYKLVFVANKLTNIYATP